MTQLYWIRNSQCHKIETDGYVGVSENAIHRFKQHRKRNTRIPDDAWLEIIFEGPREECFSKEHSLRPSKGMGWNRAVGGAQGFKTGFIHSETAKQKLKDAWTEKRRQNASLFRKEFNSSLKGQKRPSQSEAMTGDKNPMFGKTHNAEVRQKISEKSKGHVPPNKQELYCIGCHQRSSKHVLTRHGKCWKKYLSKIQSNN